MTNLMGFFSKFDDDFHENENEMQTPFPFLSFKDDGSRRRRATGKFLSPYTVTEIEKLHRI